MSKDKPIGFKQRVDQKLEAIFRRIGHLLLMLSIPAIFIWMLLPDSTTDPIKYGVEYDVPTKRVFIEKRPTNCDFGHAPIGSKDCHYDKTILTTKDSNGRVTDVYVGWNKVQE